MILRCVGTQHVLLIADDVEHGYSKEGHKTCASMTKARADSGIDAGVG